MVVAGERKALESLSYQQKSQKWIAENMVKWNFENHGVTQKNLELTLPSYSLD